MTGEAARGADLYLRPILARAHGVLGLMDREPVSPSFGCLDRTWWAWKFTDFPGARFQEGLCALAFLYATAFEGNRFYRSERMRSWIAGGFDFWARIQRPSGDFDEAYPRERSFAATAFTCFYLAEAWSFLEGALPEATAGRFRDALARAGDWLIRNDEHHGVLSNHLAAAAAALEHVHRIDGAARYRDRSGELLARILRHQSSEGWYEEYGGADPGYQTHGSFYLARLLELREDASLADSLDRSFAFLAHFVHPDGSLGGEYASRNTQTYYPAAFEMMAPRSGSAAWIAARMRQAVRDGTAVGLAGVDVYNLFPVMNNYAFAYLAACRGPGRRAPEIAPCEDPSVLHFPKAGLVKVRTRRYDLFVSLHKGGVLKLFDREKRRLALSDCGYVGRLDDGRLVSTQWSDPDRPAALREGEIRVSGPFYEVSRPRMTPLRFLAFRVASLVLGRVPRLAFALKALLVRVLVYRRRTLPGHFSRRIVLSADGIEVHDALRTDAGPQLAELTRGDFFRTIHMGSSAYFVPHELDVPQAAVDDDRDADRVDVRALRDGVELSRSLRLD